MSAERVPEATPQSPHRLLSKSEWSRTHGFSPSYVTKLLKEKRIGEIDGLIDAIDADSRWESSRRIIRTGEHAAADRARKAAGQVHVNEWRGPVLAHLSNRECVTVEDLLKNAIGVSNPAVGDRSLIRNILKSIGWRQGSIRIGGETRSAYVSPEWKPHRPQRTALAEAIVSLRKHFCETQPQFARRMNVAVASIAHYETNQIPDRPILKRLRTLATKAGRNDLASSIVSDRHPDDCLVSGCTSDRSTSSGYCEHHRRERENTLRRSRCRGNPKFLVRQRAYRVSRRDIQSNQRKQRRAEDQSYRDRDVYKKRSASFKRNIEKWCTEAYLRNAKEEDGRTTKALREWLKSFRTEPTREEKLEYARRTTRERYWRNPERERTRVQAFKHSRPDYRQRWNAERGAREAECSDGTLTKESIGRLFAASKYCPYCADPYKKSRRSLDHIVPLVKANGRKLHSITNVIVCCRTCNTKKHAKELTGFLEEIKASKGKVAGKARRAPSHPSLFECLAI